MATQTGSIDLTASNSVKLAAEAGWQNDLEDYYTKSEINVTVQDINSEVSKKVNGTEIISSINQSAESVSINANKVNLQGAVTISDLSSDAQSATLNSNISVGGRNLLPTSLVNSNVQSGVTVSGITIVLEDDGWFRVSGSKSGNSAIGLWSDGDYSTPAVPQLGNVLGKTLTWTIETEGTPFVVGSTYSTSTHIVAYGTSYSNSNRFGGAFDLVKTVTLQANSYGEIRYYIGANVPDGTTVDGRFRIMVETGNMSTAWTPAPEDTPDQMTWYGTCSTEAASATKAVVCDGFELKTGTRLAVKSTTANTANAPMLNVNGTGGIATWYNNAVSSSSNPIRWGANATLNFVYDGSVWVLDERPPSYSAACSTAAATRSKAASVVGALVVNGTRLSVRFSTANTYTANSVQVNLSSTGAHSVYQDNAVTSTTNTLLWNANTTLTFVAQGLYWFLLSRSDASKTATSYVTEITGQNGIMVHPSTDDDTGVQITSDVDILRNGHSVINVGTQGDTSGNTDAGVTIYDGTANENVVATFDSDGIGLVGGAFRLTSERVTEEYGDENNPTTMTEIRSIMKSEGSNDDYETRCFLRSMVGEDDDAYYNTIELTSETDIETQSSTETNNASVEVGSDQWGSSVRLVADSQELHLHKHPIDGKDYFDLHSEVFLMADYHNGVNMWSTVAGTVLWSSGGWYMAANQTANLAYNVSTCPTGIVLHFQPYTSSTTQNYNHTYYFVPKEHVASYSGTGVVVQLGNPGFINMATKYLYISNDHITGHADNNTTGTNSGITYNNAAWVMTQVIAV